MHQWTCLRLNDAAPQVALAMSCLRDTVTAPFQQLPPLLCCFIAEALQVRSRAAGVGSVWAPLPAVSHGGCTQVLLRPGHTMYRAVNAALLRSSRLNVRDVPLFLPLFNSGGPEFRAERTWALRMLVRGLQVPPAVPYPPAPRE